VVNKFIWHKLHPPTPHTDQTLPVRNISGITHYHGRVKIPADGKWHDVPVDLAKRLIGDGNYHVKGLWPRPVDPTDPKVSRIWKDDVPTQGLRNWPTVSIVIPVYNSPELLARCLDSLRMTKYPGPMTWILVDNASTDAMTLQIVGRISGDCLVRFDLPQGFATAANAGVKLSKADYHVLLNQDTEIIHPDWLATLIRWMILRPQCGICGPKLLFGDGSIQEAGIEFPQGTIGQHRFARLNPDVPCANWYEKVQAVTGAVFCIRSAMSDQIGLLDEEYKFGCEDTAYCLWSTLLGWEVWYVPGSVVTHHEGAVRQGTVLPRLQAWINQSHEKFRREWGAWADSCQGGGIAVLMNGLEGETA